jgi:hypothetical protein
MSTAPQTFSWKDFPEWEKFIRGLFPEMIQESLFDAIRNGKEGFEYVDDVSFFAKFHGKFGEYSELVESFLNEFSKEFTFIKMYHCCRPSETKSYYDLGIRVLDTTEMNAKFKDLFLKNPRFPQITNSYIQAAIEHMAGSYKRHGSVYFGLDDRFLVNHCGHYLIFGSEYLQSLAAFIDREIHSDLKSEFKKCGKPTVFEVRMPVSYFSDDELRELASEVFHTWAHNIDHNRTYPYELDFGKEIDHGVPSDYIIGHYHPKKIPDPSNCYENYCFDENCTAKSY